MSDLINIFIGSTADLKRERQELEKVAKIVNNTVGDLHDVQIRTIMWEIDATPQFGQHAQRIIEKQLIDGRKIDAAVFLLWNRLGTATPTADSGWLSEFEKARDIFNKRPDFEILFYVSSKPVNPRDIDGNQLAKLNQFIKSIEALYVEFKNLPELKDNAQKAFSRLIKNHHDMKRQNAKRLD